MDRSREESLIVSSQSYVEVGPKAQVTNEISEAEIREVRYNSPVPKPGDKVYVGRQELGMTKNGEYMDLVLGGEGTVNVVQYVTLDGVKEAYVGVKEHPHHLYSWHLLSVAQDSLAREYEKEKAKRSSNSWDVEHFLEHVDQYLNNTNIRHAAKAGILGNKQGWSRRKNIGNSGGGE
jgi:hypothetical protein